MLRQARGLLDRLTGSHVDRRLFPRFPTSIETICRLVGDSNPLPVLVRNVSKSGVNLLAHQQFRAGSMIRIELPHRSGDAPTILLACVMHCREEVGGWSCGCRFSEELSDQEVGVLGGDKRFADDADQRLWVRSPSKGRVEFCQLPGEEDFTEIAEIVDISPSGAGLLFSRMIEAGAAISLHLPGDRSLIACAVYVSPRPDGKFAAGCQFLRELTDAEIKSLTNPSS